MRYEIKIPLIKSNLSIFENWLLKEKNINSTYKERSVSSIYFDDINLNFANDNLTGVSNRIKFRLRWYNNSQNFNYEIKIKKNKLGNKIIIPSKKKFNQVDLKNLYTTMNKEFSDNNFMPEIKSILDKMKLLPIVKVSYKRKYYSYINSVRLTFDSPSTYTNFLDINKNINKDYMHVLEIKFHPNDYMVAQKLLHNSPFVPKRFSKYLRGLSFAGLAVYI